MGLKGGDKTVGPGRRIPVLKMLAVDGWQDMILLGIGAEGNTNSRKTDGTKDGDDTARHSREGGVSEAKAAFGDWAGNKMLGQSWKGFEAS